MVCKIAKIIIKQFIDIVYLTSKRCCIPWNQCEIKAIARQYFDSMIIEIIHNRPYCEDPLSVDLPIPIVTIDFTNIKKEDLLKKSWIHYLEQKASILLTKLNKSRDDILPKKCCLEKPEIAPDNKCNCVYKEEFTFCRPICCHDKPYDDWGKPCHKRKPKCKPYREPECPLKCVNDNSSEDSSSSESSHICHCHNSDSSSSSSSHSHEHNICACESSTDRSEHDHIHVC
jgi:hypothetical protein